MLQSRRIPRKRSAAPASNLDAFLIGYADVSRRPLSQEQNWATWAIEVPRGETIMPTDEVVFTDSVLTFKSPVTSCQPSQRGPDDVFSAPVLSTDGLSCCYDKIILRGSGWTM